MLFNNIHNPIISGWYADPEARTYGGKHWIYATRSFTEYTMQMNLDAFSSDNLTDWEKHEGIIVLEDFPWIWRAVWAPTHIEHNGKYYLIFASNDIQSDEEIGGLEIAVADHPEGPYRGYLGKPLVDRFVHQAQPIDAHLFKDEDGAVYLYYGGWGHCNVARMNEEMTGFLPLTDDGKDDKDHKDDKDDKERKEYGDNKDICDSQEYFRSITPEGYVEGPCMIKKDGLYYLMWSMGGWTNGTYRVAYGVSDNPLGPFDNKGTILQRQEPVAEGPGHHGFLHLQEQDEWLIVYHRRIIGDKEPGHRQLCMDRMQIGEGTIKPVIMT